MKALMLYWQRWAEVREHKPEAARVLTVLCEKRQVCQVELSERGRGMVNELLIKGAVF